MHVDGNVAHTQFGTRTKEFKSSTFMLVGKYVGVNICEIEHVACAWGTVLDSNYI